jgi:broad specificity phosphatase PhoE/chloramphenicol 3-O-phosphotransferase
MTRTTGSRGETAGGSGTSPRLILLRGAPGTGKTVVGYLLRQRLSPAIYLGIDTLRYLVTPRVMNPHHLRTAKIGAAGMALHYVAEGFSAILESVFEDLSIVREIDAMARTAGIGLQVFTLRSSVETAIERNTRREPFYQCSEERIRELYATYDWEVGEEVATEGKIADEVADSILRFLAREPGGARLTVAAGSGATAERKLVLFMRHGAVRAIHDRYPTDRELDLSAYGEAQVRAALGVLRAFRPTGVYSSTLLRARRTAEIIAGQLGLALTPDPRLRERYFASLAGKTLAEMASIHSRDFVDELLADPAGMEVPGEEPLEECQKRAVEALEEVARSGGDRPLIVSHGGPHSWLCCHYLGLPLSRLKRFVLGEARFSLLEFDASDRFRRILVLNSPTIPFADF